MNEPIRIRRCAIEVVNKDPAAAWADPDNHRTFAHRVQELVLGSLDQWLAPLIASRQLGERDIAALTFDLKLTPADLQGVVPLARLDLRERVVRALAAAQIEPGAERARVDTGPATKPPARAEAHAAAAGHAGEVLAGLIEAFDGGWLIQRLALTPPQALLALITRLLAEIGAPIPVADADLAELREPADPALRAAIAEAAQAARLALGHLLLALAMPAAGSSAGSGADSDAEPETAHRAPARQVRAEPLAALGAASRRLAAILATPDGELVELALTPDLAGAEAAPAAAAPYSVPAAPSLSRSSALVRGRYAAPSLLPFLALQPLCRHGLWSDFALQGEAASAIGAAFAAIVLGADNFDRAAPLCSVFAGCDGAPTGESLLAAARAGAGDLAGLAARCGALLLAGHDEAMPLLAVRADGRLLVVERDGLAPLAWLDSSDCTAFAAAGPPPLVLAGDDRAAMAELAAQALDVLCAGAPGRGEAWSLVHGPGGWIGASNLPPAPAAALARQAAWCAEAAPRAQAVWQHLFHSALAAPEQAGGEALLSLRGALSLAAGFALSELALALGRRNPAAWVDPDPLLAFERFADLSGEVEVGERLVRVHLPMGRRFIDLRDAGLLEPLDNVPWWNGHRIEFAGG